MPRTRRTPPPGAARPNRTDLAVPKVPTGLPYGERQQLEQAQQAVPVQGQQDWTALAAQAAQHPTQNVTPLDAPTQRPDEPITAGMSMGAGAGADFATIRNDPTADIVTMLEALFARWPSSELRSLLSEARGERG